jgi:cytochrome c peroxidase
MRVWLKSRILCGLSVWALALAGCGGGGGGIDGGDGAGLDVGNALVGDTNVVSPTGSTGFVDPVGTDGIGGIDETGGTEVAVVRDEVDVLLRAAMADAGVQVAEATPVGNANLVELGRNLMFDKILSGNKDIACATCHTPALGTGDALSVSIGTGGVGAGENRVLGAGRLMVPRNAPPLFNLASVDTLFWDGRVHRNNNGTFDTPAGAQLPDGLDSALAAQAMFPVTSRTEMRGDLGDTTVMAEVNEIAALSDTDLQGQWDALMTRLLNIPGYQALFRSAYPGVATNDLGFQHAANAIAAFESDQFGTFDSPFDNYLRGDDSALSEQQKQGALLFYGRARCSTCHSGALLSDFDFHNIAAPQVGPGRDPDAPLDLGRFTETGQQGDRFRFRTPILRNVANTGPWMHAGAYTTLGNAVAHYRNPANALRNYDGSQLRGDLQSLVFNQEQLNAGILDNLDQRVAPQQLNGQDVQAIVAFLESLTDPTALSRANDVPTNVPSGLPVND